MHMISSYLLIILVFILFISLILKYIELCFKFKRFLPIIILTPVVLFILFIYPRPFKSTNLAYLLPENSKNIEADFKYAGLYTGCQIEGYSISKMEYEKDSAGSLVNSSAFSPWYETLNRFMYSESYFYAMDFNECYDDYKSKYGVDLEKIITYGNENYQIKIGGTREYPTHLPFADILIFSINTPGAEKLIFLKGVAPTWAGMEPDPY